MRNPYFALLKTAWQYTSDQKGRFIFIYTMFVVANIIVALNPILYGWFVNDIQQHGADALSTGWIYAASFLGLRLIEWAFHGPARVMERKLAFNISKNYLESLYTKVLHLPMKWHQENHSGATISKLRKAHEALREFFQNGFIYLYSIGKFVFSFGAMLYFSPLFGSIGVLLGIITVFIIMKFDVQFIKSLKEVNKKENEVSSTLFDSLSNILTVITLRLEKSMKTGFMSKVKNVYPPFRRNVVINEWKWFVAQMMVGLIYAVITVGYIYQHAVPGETFMIGGLIILLGYVNQFTSVFNDIAAQYTQIVKFDTDVQNARDLEEASMRYPLKTSDNRLPDLWKEMSISNLNFVRENAGERTGTGIHALDMRIEKGQKIALIGESGSGKSTLLSLLRGLHEPLPGSHVVINNYGDIPFSDIASAVMLFPQEPEIFENTVRYNITLGLPFSEEVILKACENAQLLDVLHKLPNGLDTFLHEKGANLSGGQRQRLALARGILAAQSSDIILMDEPTSSVDPKTERLLYQNLFERFADKAVVSSLHRLHLLPYFDYIYILKNGNIIDEGTFADLTRYSLVLQEMMQHQTEEDKTPASLNVAR
ncbi:ABC transporter ATP-binding protein [Pseudochryseolinea flava]|uniref:ABC transporter ATP-binding protein n=1 Tax=Pseudochryseolinea flava TaxID=2059302 RepID=A0A364XXH9_9BACT|nr:ABC transporter ATP-binding protein [Pseudochryseolinea flava]RAV98924.1 ABC transporter ATP-binding protein [Pseudochryseolinea flava]